MRHAAEYVGGPLPAAGGERQAPRDGGEFVAAAHAVLAEAPGKDAADGGNEGSSSGQEDAVDLAWIGACRRKQRIDGALDRMQSSAIQASKSARVTGICSSMLPSEKRNSAASAWDNSNLTRCTAW